MLGKHFVKMEEEGAGESGGAGGSESPTLEEIQAQLAEIRDERDKLKQHNEALFSETKKAKEAKREYESKLKEAQQKKASEDGNFEQLYNSQREENERLQREKESIIEEIHAKDRKTTAMKIAANLAEGPNAAILSEFIERRLATDDGEIRVKDGAGNLTVATLDDLANEFANDKTFASLLKGNQSGGSGASNQANTSGGTAKQITRSEFDNKSPVDKMKYLKNGGTLVDG